MRSRSRGRYAAPVQQRPHDHRRQRRLNGVQLLNLCSLQTQQCLSQPAFTAAATVFVSSEPRSDRTQETRGEHGAGFEGQSAAAQCVEFGAGSSSESVESLTHVEPLPGLWGHSQLLPQPHTQIQTSRQCSPVAAFSSSQEKRWSGVGRSTQKTVCCWNLRTTTGQLLSECCRGLGLSSQRGAIFHLLLSAPALAPPMVKIWFLIGR